VKLSKYKKEKKQMNAKGSSTEVYPFRSPRDIKNILAELSKERNHIHVLLFTVSINTGRRIGDILRLKWGDIYYVTGAFRNEMRIQEEKTDKYASVKINDAVKECFKGYCKLYHIEPWNIPNEPVFIQREGQSKGKNIVIAYETYLRTLQKAARAAGITYPVGTHSARKTFGYWSKFLHPNDPNATSLLMVMFNHSSERMTANYIGVTKDQADKYIDDFGEFFHRYIVEGEFYEEKEEMPIVHYDKKTFVKLLTDAYYDGTEHGTLSASEHNRRVNDILARAEGLALS
jgi:integrase